MLRALLPLILWLASILISFPAYADMKFVERSDVRQFIAMMVKKYNFKRSDLITVFNAVKVRPAVIRSVKTPLESNPWRTYQMLFVTEWRIREGVKFWNKYQDVLARAEKTYGVPASIIVATIGVETKYGQNTGEYPVIDALTNLAFSNSPRAPYFKKELEQFLLLARDQNTSPLKIYGSYAGAIGQPQFMPSSYRNYAVDFSGDQHIDLSHNEVDVIGSIANYYQKHGWLTDQPIAIPASINNTQFELLADQSKALKPFSQLQLAKYGINPHGNFLKNQKNIKLLPLDGYFGNEYWLTFHNFDVIKRYNTSSLYAMAVYQLSYYITALREKTNDI